MTNQLPPDVEYISIPQTKTTEKIDKPAYDSKNYLDFSIPEGKTSREITIRLLPVNINGDKGELFQIVHLHNIPVNKELKPNKSGKKAYMCLNSKNTGVNHEVYGDKCPICEAQQELWKKWREETNDTKKKEILKEIKNLEIREYCIVRCIERGKEDEGPKFWRILLRQDQTDAYHKITLLGETRKQEGLEAGVNVNIFSIYDGRDLTIKFTEGTGAPTVIDKGISTPLTKDNELLNKWYYDEKKWSDVFSTKPYDYLKLVLEGEVPWYDKNTKTWISQTDFEKNKTNAELNANDSIKAAESQYLSQVSASPVDITSTYNSPMVSNDETELPF